MSDKNKAEAVAQRLLRANRSAGKGKVSDLKLTSPESYFRALGRNHRECARRFLG